MYLKLVLYKNVTNFYVIYGLLWMICFSYATNFISDELQMSCNDNNTGIESVTGNCLRHSKHAALQCYGSLHNLNGFNEQKLKKLEHIIICNWTKPVLNPSIELQQMPKIKSFTIKYGDMKNISANFPEMYHLQIINITRTNLSYLVAKTFKHIYSLRILDLRWNQLKHMDVPLIMPQIFEKLYLKGNPWNCTRNLKWLLLPDKGDMVTDRDDMYCSDRKYKDRHVLTVMNYKVSLKTTCQSYADLKNCSCSMHHIIPKSHIPLYTVNCSYLQFYNLPNYLPDNTSSLFMNGNKISDISPLSNNIYYTHLADIHLDNNLIESIDVLEGGYWLENFRLLSLRSNRLKKIPVYALDNALEDNTHANLLLLSDNPWYCSCKFSMRFREILMKYKTIIKDAQNITCTYKKAGETILAQIMSLTREEVCKPQEETSIFYLDIINGVMIGLIVLILGKLAYDYYHYKYYGRVPWIVMKMP